MTAGPLSGRHALVTGASGGIGSATALALARAGARVSIAGRREAALEALARELGRAAGALAVFDVADEAAAEAAATRVETEAGPLDILVNNAGSAESAPFARVTTRLWRAMMAANLDGAFFLTRAIAPGMARRGFGRIVNVASTAGLVAYPYVSAYVAAKHGLVGLTRALALEYAARGVTANAVCPGYVETPLLEGALAAIVARTGRSAQDARAALTRTNPSGRLVRPREVAATIVHLASPEAESVNGQAIAIAGGEVMTR